jgi:competence protein ComEC
LIEYNNYKNFTRFDSSIVNATVLKQYTKTKVLPNKKVKIYQVLKLKAEQGFFFYPTQNQLLTNLKAQKIQLELFTKELSFYHYLTTFYGYSKNITIIDISNKKSELNDAIATIHQDKNISAIYQALFSATPLPKELQTLFATLGISHLLAISGFHLGVLAAILLFLFKIPYRFLQNRYFPYRSYNKDSFIFIAFILAIYVLFLDTPASLLRAYFMLVIGFFLYDRGYKIVSMQTLFVSVLALLSFFPRLFFSIGFWLSVCGVFYIFLFLIYFDTLKKQLQFILLPVWIYLMMLPFSLSIFSTFSLYHPFSIVLSFVFIIFYPLSIFLHLIGFGGVLDWILNYLFMFDFQGYSVEVSIGWFYLYIALSLASMFYKELLWIVVLFSGSFLIFAIFWR